MERSRNAIEAAEGNYFAAWRLLATRAAGGVVEETDNILFTSVPAPVAYFNSAFVKPPADHGDCIEIAVAFFAARDKPFTLRFRNASGSDAACESAGLVSAGVSPLMNASIETIAPPSSFDIRRVDFHTWAEHVSTIADGFGMPLELLTGVLPPALCESDEYAGFNAYVDGHAASTAALIAADGVAGVYNVATPEPFRRRGLGEATTRAAIAEGARRGCVTTTLQASEMGYPIYERMGFKTVVRWTSYASA